MDRRRTLRRPPGTARPAEPPLRLSPNFSERPAKSSVLSCRALDRELMEQSPAAVPGGRGGEEGPAATSTTALTHPLMLYSLPAWDRLTP